MISDTGGNAETSHRENFDRRVHPRQPVPSLAYLELHEGNGGIILNASEGGLAVQAAASLTDDVLPAVRFQLPQSRTWVELRVRAAWIGDSRKVAGLEFLDLSEETRTQIKKWLSSEAEPPAKKKAELPPKVHGWEPALPRAAVVAPLRAPARAPTTTPSANSSFATIFARSHAAQPSIPGLSVARASRRPRRRGSRGTPITLAIIGIILASLAAGWASGHGVFSKMVQTISSISWYHNAADPDAMPRSTGRIAPISQIEIVDGNNQRWAISFNGPMSAWPPSPRWQSSGRAPVPVSPPQIPFQTWVLSAPVRSSGEATGNGQERENAPVLPNGAENGSPTSLGLPPSSLTAPQPAPPAQPRGAGLRPGDLILRVEPIYPTIAKEHGIGGTVKLRVTVGPDGIVRGLELVSGPQVLVGAARTAVLQWRYAPTTLDGQAIETEKEITLVFQSPQP